MKKYLSFLLLLFLFTGCFGNRLIKTGTLADRKVNLTYLLKNIEVKTAKGEKVKVILTSNGSSYVTKKGKYIASPNMSIIEKFHNKTIGEELKKSSITGEEKMVPVIQKISEGFVADYSFKLSDRTCALNIHKVTLNLLNAKGDFQKIHEHILTSEEQEKLLTTGIALNLQSDVFIPKDHFIKGDRRFLYIYQIVVEDSNHNILESLNAYSLLWYHEINYDYIQGYN
ncbi:MAG TPA: hypothetical protein VIG61_08330 [Fusobacterium sp.]|uniref:hypothetical protein n=1 Tax=Fusobacterium sp. TaxID=68766 RepID=UPI002F3EF0C9